MILRKLCKKGGCQWPFMNNVHSGHILQDRLLARVRLWLKSRSPALYCDGAIAECYPGCAGSSQHQSVLGSLRCLAELTLAAVPVLKDFSFYSVTLRLSHALKCSSAHLVMWIPDNPHFREWADCFPENPVSVNAHDRKCGFSGQHIVLQTQ